MSTIEQELIAAADTRLLARAVQTAKHLRIPNAQALIESRFGELVSLNTTSEGAKTIAEEHDFAVQQWKTKKAELDQKQAALNAEYDALREPGADPARVTDEYLVYAVKQLTASEVHSA